MNLEDHIRDYLSECRSRGLSQNTLNTYQNSLGKFGVWARTRKLTLTSEVTRTLLREYSSELGTLLQPGGAHARLRVMRSFFRWLHAEEEILKNPMERVALPRLSQQIGTAVGLQEVRQLLECAKGTRNPLRDAAIIGTLFDCGLRVSELCGLGIADVIPAGRLEVRQGKGGKVRVIPISRVALRLIRRYVDGERGTHSALQLFVSATGTAMNRDGVKQLLSRLCGLAVVKSYSPHTFRRGFAVEYLRAGGDVFSLQRILGHSTLEMTRRYVALSGEDLRVAHLSASPLSRLK